MAYPMSPANPLPRQFEDYAHDLRSIALGKYISLVVYGAAGIGKSFLADSYLPTLVDEDETPVIQLGTPSAAGFYEALWNHPTAIFVIDDVTKLLLTNDADTISLVKAALDQQRKGARIVSRVNNRTLHAVNGPESEFEISARFVFIMNPDPTDPKLQERYPELKVLRSRVNDYCAFSSDPADMGEYVLSLAVDQRLLLKGGTEFPASSIADANMAMAYFRDNLARLPEISVRQLRQIAIRINANPTGWRFKCDQQLLPIARPLSRLPAEAVLIADGKASSTVGKSRPDHRSGATRTRKERRLLNKNLFLALMQRGQSPAQIAEARGMKVAHVLATLALDEPEAPTVATTVAETVVEAPQDAPEAVPMPSLAAAVASLDLTADHQPPAVAPAKPKVRAGLAKALARCKLASSKPDLLMDEVPSVVPSADGASDTGQSAASQTQQAATVVTDVPAPKAKRGRPPKTERPFGDAEQILAISRNAIKKIRAKEAAK